MLFKSPSPSRHYRRCKDKWVRDPEASQTRLLDRTSGTLWHLCNSNNKVSIVLHRLRTTTTCETSKIKSRRTSCPTSRCLHLPRPFRLRQQTRVRSHLPQKLQQAREDWHRRRRRRRKRKLTCQQAWLITCRTWPSSRTQAVAGNQKLTAEASYPRTNRLKIRVVISISRG